MISPRRKHQELQKLSDKFQQPFETRTGSVHAAVVKFNQRKQKKFKGRKK
jgi:hypothetical protein